MHDISVFQGVPTLLATFRNPYFLQINCGSIMERCLRVFSRYPFPKGQINLVGVVNPAKKWSVVPEIIPDFKWLEEFPPDKCYFIFSLDGNVDAYEINGVEFDTQIFDDYAHMFISKNTGRMIRYLVIGIRQMALQRANNPSLAATFVALRAFTNNWRTRRLKYNRNPDHPQEMYRGRNIGMMHAYLFNMPLLKCIEQVPYPLWIFCRELWIKWPNVISSMMLNEFSVTYYSEFLIEAAQTGQAGVGLNAHVRSLISQVSDANADSVGEYLALSAYDADYELVAGSEIADLTFNDCTTMNTSAWPFLTGYADSDSFDARREELTSLGFKFD